MNIKISSCSKCNAPIYAATITSLPLQYSCECRNMKDDSIWFITLLQWLDDNGDITGSSNCGWYKTYDEIKQLIESDKEGNLTEAGFYPFIVVERVKWGFQSAAVERKFWEYLPVEMKWKELEKEPLWAIHTINWFG